MRLSQFLTLSFECALEAKLQCYSVKCLMGCLRCDWPPGLHPHEGLHANYGELEDGSSVSRSCSFVLCAILPFHLLPWDNAARRPMPNRSPLTLVESTSLPFITWSQRFCFVIAARNKHYQKLLGSWEFRGPWAFVTSLFSSSPLPQALFSICTLRNDVCPWPFWRSVSKLWSLTTRVLEVRWLPLWQIID
jgi:hypothetical protein